MPRVAIIGGGCAGTLTAIHLLRAGAAVTVIERRAELGPGVAYSTVCTSHLLNVPAGRMSGFPDAPDHFRNWAEGELGRVVAPAEFLPRAVYGRYLRATLAAERARTEPAALAHVRTDAVGVHVGEPGAVVSIELSAGDRVEADACVLALGHAAPADPPVRSGAPLSACPCAIRDPWSAGALEGLDARAPILLIGTGLTMLDMVLALDDRGHRGVITAVSRRGLLPRWHAEMPVEAASTAMQAVVTAVEAGDTPVEAARKLRSASAAGAWRAQIDAVRGITPAVWSAWTPAQRGSFLRHARPMWDVHRHRAAPQIGRRIDALLGEGRVRVIAGRIESWAPRGGGTVVSVSRRDGGDVEAIDAARILNCTGPCADIGRSSNPLVHRLVRDGVIRRDALGLGVETDGAGRAVGSDGRVRESVWVVGSWRVAGSWESVAVPELRVQARDVARAIAGS
jgi:uncharacterized NAD(P)/FAD-binding protein YdhS